MSRVFCPQKLIRLCALPGSTTEKEEAGFLLVICSRVKQDPHVLRYVLEVSNHQWGAVSVMRSYSDIICASSSWTSSRLPANHNTAHRPPINGQSHAYPATNQILPLPDSSNQIHLPQKSACCGLFCSSPGARSVS